MTPEQLENRPRLVRGSARGLYESFYVKANDPTGRRALWIRFTFLSPRGRPDEALAETWAILFDRETGRHRACKQAHAIAASSASGDPFRVRIGDSVLETGHTAGAMVSGHGPVRWDLSFTTTSFLHRPFPLAAMYESALPKHKTVTPYPDELFDGWFEVGDERVEVVGWPGFQSHNWGTEHTHLYVWSHCNLLGAPGTWFEAAAGRVKLGPVVLPWLGVATVSLGGRRVHFDAPTSLARVRSRLERTTRGDRSAGAPGWGWRFGFRRADCRLDGELSGDREDFVGLTYEGPSGPPTHCLNSKIAHLRATLREGSLPPVHLESDGAAFEVGTHRTDHGIRMAI